MAIKGLKDLAWTVWEEKANDESFCHTFCLLQRACSSAVTIITVQHKQTRNCYPVLSLLVLLRFTCLHIYTHFCTKLLPQGSWWSKRVCAHVHTHTHTLQKKKMQTLKLTSFNPSTTCLKQKFTCLHLYLCIWIQSCDQPCLMFAGAMGRLGGWFCDCCSHSLSLSCCRSISFLSSSSATTPSRVHSSHTHLPGQKGQPNRWNNHWSFHLVKGTAIQMKRSLLVQLVSF